MKPYAIDIDDVIADFCTIMHRALSLEFPDLKPVTQWHDFDMSKRLGIAYPDFLELIVEHRLIERVQPLEGATTAIEQLKQSGVPVVLITSRGYHPRGTEATKDWLEEHSIAYDDLIIVPHGMTKAQAAAPAYPAGFSYMIDDLPENLVYMKEAGLVTNTVLIDKPWNQLNHSFRMGSSRFECLQSFVVDLQRQSSRTRTCELELAS